MKRQIQAGRQTDRQRNVKGVHSHNTHVSIKERETHILLSAGLEAFPVVAVKDNVVLVRLHTVCQRTDCAETRGLERAHLLSAEALEEALVLADKQPQHLTR
jgi:hypothetical protein